MIYIMLKIEKYILCKNVWKGKNNFTKLQQGERVRLKSYIFVKVIN